MEIKIKNKILQEITNTIKGSIYENKVFVVGGFVRDLIMGKESNDIDLLIDGDINAGIDFADWFCKEKNIYKKDSNPLTYGLYGTAMFRFMGEKIESVAPRSEKYKNGSRNPEVSSCSLKEDCFRRDFTINSLFINISTNELIDYSGYGVDDIKNKIIRSTSSPEIIFNDDSLRILRMIRFASRFNFNIDFDTFQCAKKFVDRLEIISKERITDEFTKMLTFSISSAVKAICLLWDIGAYRFIIPYFDKSNTKEKVDVVNSLTEFNEYYLEWDAPYTIVEDKIIPILANLLYHTYTFVYKEGIKYYLSEILKYPNDVINKVVFLIEKSYELKNNKDVTSIRRIMNQCGNAETFYLATIIGSNWLRSAYHTKYYDLEPTFFEKMDDKNYMFYGYKLPVTGEDVMEIFNISPSPKIKEILDKTYNHVLHYPEHSDRDNCIEFLKQLKDSDDENVLS